jgi:hypothetical protein
VQIDGASLDKSEVRLLLEAEDFSLSFSGNIKSDGTVKIPIKKLKGILEENFKGKISLEVIAEDTVFIPWENEYITDTFKKVKVDIDESLSETVFESIKPRVTFTMKEELLDTIPHINELKKIMRKNKVEVSTLMSNPKTLNKLVETYCHLNHITDDKMMSGIKKDLLRIK